MRKLPSVSTLGPISSDGHPPREFVKILDWLRQLGFATFLVGFIGAIGDPSLFWMSVSLFYFGASLILLDLVFQTKLLKLSKFGIGIAIIIAIASFSKFFVFVPADLGIGSIALPQPPPLTTTQITWNSNFSAVQIDLMNLSEVNLDDVTLVLKPAKPVTAAAIVSAPPDAVLKPIDPTVPNVEDVNGSGKLVTLPIILIATDKGYSLRCASLVPGEHILLLIALADMEDYTNKNRATAPQSSEEWGKQFMNPSYCIESGSPSNHCWYGYYNFDGYKPLTGTCKLSFRGTYVAAHRRRLLEREIEPFDFAGQIKKSGLVH